MNDRSSFTAETMALQRAFESNRATHDRLFTDAHAEAFLHGTLRMVAAMSRLPVLCEVVGALYDAIAGVGPRASAIIRTRVIDDLVDGLAPSVGQVVILGAGFDCRAHRLPVLASKCVFEVDHPATQRTKRQVIQKHGLYRADLNYVPVDFERESFEKRLLTGGFNPKTNTLFLWEGVTNYLTAEAVEQTLATIRNLGTTGGILIFTYVHAGVLDGSVHFQEARRWLANVKRVGEPWTFGWRPEDLAEYLEARRFVLESDVSMAEARGHLLGQQRRLRGASALYRVAVARPGSPGPTSWR
jgi:methyltransferase (TIGR00027 family)